MSDSIHVRDLQKRYGASDDVLRSVDFRVAKGEIVALVGANGAGKSTLLRCLVRLVEPSGGHIHVGGKDVVALDSAGLRRLRARVGFVFQRFNLVPRLTAFHNVQLGLLGSSGPRGWWPATARQEHRALAMQCLARVGLERFADRRADTLSGGQQQRVAIAWMLMQAPDIVLADEPVASLDPVAGVAVMELLRDIGRERGMTVVVALHHLELARRYTDRLIGLRDGRVVLDLATRDWRPTAVDALYHPVAA